MVGDPGRSGHTAILYDGRVSIYTSSIYRCRRQAGRPWSDMGLIRLKGAGRRPGPWHRMRRVRAHHLTDRRPPTAIGPMGPVQVYDGPGMACRIGSDAIAIDVWRIDCGSIVAGAGPIASASGDGGRGGYLENHASRKGNVYLCNDILKSDRTL